MGRTLRSGWPLSSDLFYFVLRSGLTQPGPELGSSNPPASAFFAPEIIEDRKWAFKSLRGERWATVGLQREHSGAAVLKGAISGSCKE